MTQQKDIFDFNTELILPNLVALENRATELKNHIKNINEILEDQRDFKNSPIIKAFESYEHIQPKFGLNCTIDTFQETSYSFYDKMYNIANQKVSELRCLYDHQYKDMNDIKAFEVDAKLIQDEIDSLNLVKAEIENQLEKLKSSDKAPPVCASEEIDKITKKARKQLEKDTKEENKILYQNFLQQIQK